MTIEVDRHAEVGPITDMYGHGPVTAIDFRDGNRNSGKLLAVCLDCGYVAPDAKMLFDVECDEEDNHITQSWRERLDDEGYPDGFGNAPE